MDQAAKLEPFLLLAKNAKGKAAAELINRVTEEPGIYGFGELLDIAGIKEVRHHELPHRHKIACMQAAPILHVTYMHQPYLTDMELLRLE